jgi:hypothetical protein
MPSTPSLDLVSRPALLLYLAQPGVFYGKADPGSTVQVWNGSTLLSTVTANTVGEWTTPALSLADGSYHLTAISIDAAGAKSAASTGTPGTCWPMATIR